MWFVIIILILCVGFIFWKKQNIKQSLSGDFSQPNLIGYDFNIVGEASYQSNLEKIAGNKQEQAKYHQCMAKISSEPSNKFDKNAIKVEINGLIVGYLSKSDAKQLTGRNIDKLVPAVIDGGWDDGDSTGQYGVKLAIKNPQDLL